MTVDLMGSLQVAIYDRLTAELAVAGFGGAAVPVYDHPPADPHDRAAMHARIEAFNILPVDTKNTHPARHRFTVRIFDGDGSGGAAVRGQMEIKRVAGLAVVALQDWQPFAGGNAVRHLGTSIPSSDTGSGFESSSRFEVHL